VNELLGNIDCFRLSWRVLINRVVLFHLNNVLSPTETLHRPVEDRHCYRVQALVKHVVYQLIVSLS